MATKFEHYKVQEPQEKVVKYRFPDVRSMSAAMDKAFGRSEDTAVFFEKGCIIGYNMLGSYSYDTPIINSFLSCGGKHVTEEMYQFPDDNSMKRAVIQAVCVSPIPVKICRVKDEVNVICFKLTEFTSCDREVEKCFLAFDGKKMTPSLDIPKESTVNISSSR